MASSSRLEEACILACRVGTMLEKCSDSSGGGGWLVPVDWKRHVYSRVGLAPCWRSALIVPDSLVSPSGVRPLLSVQFGSLACCRER